MVDGRSFEERCLDERFQVEVVHFGTTKVVLSNIEVWQCLSVEGCSVCPDPTLIGYEWNRTLTSATLLASLNHPVATIWLIDTGRRDIPYTVTSRMLLGDIALVGKC